MIVFDQVSIRYAADKPVIVREVNLSLPEGQLILLTGRTGSGKSTLLGAINGHVPHFTGGILTGRVLVDGMDTAKSRPRDMAHLVGVVPQDPLAGFVTDTVEEELAYGMEQAGVASAVMRTRVEETMDILGLADLRLRSLRSLSGGQQQRVAIGSVLATGARVLVLDEPTSALDPVSSEEVLASLLRLVHDIGLTVVIAEHRLERVAGYADRMILLAGGGQVIEGSTTEIMAISPLVPPVVDLGRRAQFPDTPLTVRQARHQVAPLRTALARLDPHTYQRLPIDASSKESDSTERSGLVIHNLSVSFGPHLAVHNLSAILAAGQVTVIMGRNGSGKSSLLWALAGVQPLTSGTFAVNGTPLHNLAAKKVRDYIRLVPQTATDLLYLPTVELECQAADRESGANPGSCMDILNTLVDKVDPAWHPRDLSEGQKLCLVLAIQLTVHPQVIVLDEPTRGLDYPAKRALSLMLTRMAAEGQVVGVVTHDVEFAAEVADQIIVMATGEVIQSDEASVVLATSALFAPQVAKVLYPAQWLTPYQVGQALRDRP